MSVSADIIERIREQSAIEDVVSRVVSLQSSGRTGVLKGLCPFHAEDTPSFTVNTVKGLYFCFGCQEGGDVFGFVQKTRGLNFFDAIKELADECGVELRAPSEDEKQRFQTKQSLYDICQIATEYFQKQLQGAQGTEARAYLKERGVAVETQVDFELGYAPNSSEEFLMYMHQKQVSTTLLVEAGLARYKYPDKQHLGVYAMFRHRLIIPIRNAQGKVVAFGGRRMPSDESSPAKYINSPETSIYKKSQVLYGLSFARSAIQKQKRVIIVEGYFDVIALHSQGFRETIATCGTALTPEHIKVLRPLTTRAIAMFDMDEAGRRAAEKSLPMFWEAGIEPLRLSLGDAKDPDEYFLHTENARSNFENLLTHAEPLFVTTVQNLVEKVGKTAGSVQQIVEDVIPLLQKMPPIARSASVSYVASTLGIPVAVVQSQLSKQRENTIITSDPTAEFPKILLDVFWFSIHYPAKMVEHFLSSPDNDGVSPNMITSNQEQLLVLVRLLQGHQLMDVLEQVAHETLKKALLQLAMQQEIYTPENVVQAICQIKALYRVQYLKNQIQQTQMLIPQLAQTNPNLLLEKVGELHNLRLAYEATQKKVFEVVK